MRQLGASKTSEEDAIAAGRAIIASYKKEIEEYKKTIASQSVDYKKTLESLSTGYNKTIESLDARYRNEIAECKRKVEDYKGKNAAHELKAAARKRVITSLNKQLSDKTDGRTPFVIADGDQERLTSDAERSMFGKGFREGLLKGQVIKHTGETRKSYWIVAGATGVVVLGLLSYREGYLVAMQEIAKTQDDWSIVDEAHRALERHKLVDLRAPPEWRSLFWKK
jgi:predicted RNase H-like nuclease (RuvC/YqgF family)